MRTKNTEVGVLSTGTGGTNIGKEAWLVCQQMQRAGNPGVTDYLFIETNRKPWRAMLEMGVPRDQVLLIGQESLGGWGSYNDPSRAAAALMADKDAIMAWMRTKLIIFLVATGGKGTGMGTFPLLMDWAQDAGKWVIPVFAEPALGPEIELDAHGRVLQLIEEVRRRKIRMIHVLNSRVFDRRSNLSQDVAFTQINRAIGGSIGSLASMIAEGSQIDWSDLARFFAGHGDLYVGRAAREMNPGVPNEEEIHQAAIDMARECFANPYLRFEGGIHQAFWGVTIHRDWPAWVQKELKEAGSARLLELFDKKPPRSTVPPARFPVDRGYWGLTVMLSSDTGDHQPLRLPKLPDDDEVIPVFTMPEFDRVEVPAATVLSNADARPETVVHQEDAVATSAAAVPPLTERLASMVSTARGIAGTIADRVRNSVGSAPAAATAAAPTAPAPREEFVDARDLAEEIEDLPMEVPSAFGSGFSAFLKAVNSNDRDAVELAKQNDLSGMKIEIPLDVLKKTITDFTVFKSAFGKFSPAWKELILRRVSDVEFPDLKIEVGTIMKKAKSLQVISCEDFLLWAVSHEGNTLKMTTDLRFVYKIAELYGVEGYKACLSQTAGSKPPARRLIEQPVVTATSSHATM